MNLLQPAPDVCDTNTNLKYRAFHFRDQFMIAYLNIKVPVVHVLTLLRPNIITLGSAAIAQWIRLRLPAAPGLSPKHTINAFIQIYLFVSCRKDENKQKEAGIGPFLETLIV